MILFEHPILIAVAVIFSLLLAVFVYRKDDRFSNAPKSSRILLFSLRFISLLIVSLLVLKPKWLQNSKDVEKPILVFLQDASTSILNHADSTYYKTEFKNTVFENNRQLSDDYEVYTYHFGRDLKNGLVDKFTENSTDISNALQGIHDRFHNRNLAGVLMASDGNYNRGIHPYYQISKLNTPLYTLALGDTARVPDLSVTSIRHNEIAYFENEFPIEFDLKSNFSSDRKYQIVVEHDDEAVYEEWVKLKPDVPLTKKIYLQAKNKGIQYYNIRIVPFDGEENKLNNQQQIALDVLNDLQKILVLSSAPHPDVSALRSALQVGQNYEVKSALFHEFKDDIEPYNLIVLHQIPDFTNRNKQLLNRIFNSKTALFIIGASASNWTGFKEIENNVQLKRSGNLKEVFPLLNENFAAFELSENCKEFIQNTPPLLSPFEDIKISQPKRSLLKRKTADGENMQELLCFKEINGKDVAILLAEGLWKWRLFDYQKNKAHDNFNEYIQAISQYLTVNKDKRKLRLQYDKLITEGEPFEIDAQLYDDRYNLVKKASMDMLLSDKNDNDYRFTLIPEGTTYKAKIESLGEGKYSFIINSDYKGNTQSQKGVLTVLSSQLESQDETANWELLEKLSNQSGGAMMTKDSFGEYAAYIKKNVKQKPRIHYLQYLSDLIKQKGIFLVLLLCLFFEWAIRKRLGTH